MGVAELLELPDGNATCLLEAQRCWPEWEADWPILRLAGGAQRLRPWTKEAGPARADEALHALATIAAEDGGDRREAASVLAWTLLPAAVAMAHSLRTASPRIDEIVAGQLWIETRSFPWQRLHKVAANIVLNTRAGVLAECGMPAQVRRMEPTWSRTVPVVDTAPIWVSRERTMQPADEPARFADEVEEIAHVLQWSAAGGVITADDSALLVSLLAQAHRTAPTSSRRGSYGLLGNELTEAVAVQLDVSAATVRRHARRSIDALSVACNTDAFRLSA